MLASYVSPKRQVEAIATSLVIDESFQCVTYTVCDARSHPAGCGSADPSAVRSSGAVAIRHSWRPTALISRVPPAFLPDFTGTFSPVKPGKLWAAAELEVSQGARSLWLTSSCHNRKLVTYWEGLLGRLTYSW